MDEPLTMVPDNPNPVVVDPSERKKERKLQREEDTSTYDNLPAYMDPLYVYDIIRTIQDPEHPYSLEELQIVDEDLVSVDRSRGEVVVQFTPTVPHCSLAATIGLCIRMKLYEELTQQTKIRLLITPGSHHEADEITRRINDKERVVAAMENPDLRRLVENCIRDREY